MDDVREYRTELIWAPCDGSAWAEQPGWNLYVDGTLVARTERELPAATAQQWANAQLGEGVTWLPGQEDETWYWVANPRPHQPHRAQGRGRGEIR
ncbi:hypothetical protein [Saccharopolyspora taberi]|uniref:Uncharacterized protein n=1 Tax=Saccharopolyspora taberi TaxID=60895 RepID=A0ABN3VI23_9PSEU